MDLLPKAKKEIIRYIRVIRNDPFFLNLMQYLKFSLLFSPFVLICTFLILKRRREMKLKETFNHRGLFQILKNDINKRSYIISDNYSNKILDNFYKFSRKTICYTNPTGIHNYGNNCYMNSLLQVILLYSKFLNNNYKINLLYKNLDKIYLLVYDLFIIFIYSFI